MGGDWAFPTTAIETQNYFANHFSSWSYIGNLFGDRLFSPTSLFFASILKALSLMGAKGDISPKIILVTFFALASTNFNLLLRYFKVNSRIAFFGGLLYVFSPIFFNYFLMGWQFVILFMAILPLIIYFFDISINKNNYRLALLVALLFSLVVVQSQALVWVPIVLLSMSLSYFSDKKKLYVSFKMLALIFFVFVLLNMYWLPGMLLLQDSELVDTSLVNSVVSLGTAARLSVPNLLRLWGSLFNYQFETSYNLTLSLISFIVPLLAVLGAIAYKTKRYAIYLLFLFIVPILFYALDRDILSSIPFSGLLRDIARFTVLSTFSAVALVSLFLNYIYTRFKKKKWLVGLLAIILLLNIMPFFNSSLYEGRVNDYDFRLRTFQLSSDQITLEKMFDNEKEGKTALFLPIGGTISTKDNVLFKGAYQEMQDLYAGFSSVPGVSSISDRSTDASGDMLKEINRALVSGEDQNFKNIINRLDIEYIVFRRNLEYRDNDSNDVSGRVEEMIEGLVRDGTANIYYDSGNILAVEISHKIDQVEFRGELIGFDYPLLEVARELTTENMTNLISKDNQRLIRKYFETIKKNTDENGEVYSIINQNEFYGAGTLKESSATIIKPVSLKELSEIFVSVKLNLEKQVAMTNDTKVISKNKSIINMIDRNQFIADPGYYMVYLDEGVSESRLYFDNGEAKEANISINDEGYRVERTDKGMMIDNINLKKGLNTIYSLQMEPSYIEIKNDNAFEYPNESQLKVDRINNSRYKVSVLGKPNTDFLLTFNDSFDKYWHLYDKTGIGKEIIVDDASHFIANGYCNGWIINPDDLHFDENGKATFYIEYEPQDYFVYGSIITIISVISIFAFFIIKKLKIK